MIHPHLADHDLGIIGGVVETQRRADEVVEVAPGLPRAALRSDQRRDHFFRRRFAGRTGDADEEEAIALPNRSRQLLQRLCRVGNANNAFVARNRVGHVRDDGAASSLQRLRNELVTVEAIALDREEDGVGFDLAAVDDDRGDFDVGVLEDFAAGHLGQVLEGQRWHC